MQWTDRMRAHALLVLVVASGIGRARAEVCPDGYSYYPPDTCLQVSAGTGADWDGCAAACSDGGWNACFSDDEEKGFAQTLVGASSYSYAYFGLKKVSGSKKGFVNPGTNAKYEWNPDCPDSGSNDYNPLPSGFDDGPCLKLLSSGEIIGQDCDPVGHGCLCELKAMNGVIGFELWNAKSNEKYVDLDDDAVVTPEAGADSKTYSIKAVISGEDPSNVIFNFDGAFAKKEVKTPFFIAGDKGGDPVGYYIETGVPHTVEAIPSSGQSLKITFTIKSEESGVIGFELWNAETDEKFGDLDDNDIVTPEAGAGPNTYSIRAVTTGDEPSRVSFKLDGVKVRTEKKTPWFIAGDYDDDIFPFYIESDVLHTVEAIPTSGESKKISFTILSSSVGNVRDGGVVGFELWNAETDEKFVEFGNHAVITPEDGTRPDSYNIKAIIAGDEPSQVVFKFDGVKVRKDKTAPFFAGGGSSSDIYPFYIERDVPHTIKAVPSSGDSLKFTFTINSLDGGVIGFELWNAVTDEKYADLDDNAEITAESGTGPNSYTIKAVISGDEPDEVVFKYDGVKRSTERVAPFFLGANRGSDALPFFIERGTVHTVEAIPTSGDSLKISFKILSAP